MSQYFMSASRSRLNRRLFVGGLTATAGLRLGGRALAAPPDPNRSASITSWGFGAEETNPMAYARIQAFNQAFPNIKLELVPQFDDQKLLTGFASKQLPDLIWMPRSVIASWAQRGVLMPLDDYFNDGTIDTSQLYPAALDEVTIDGKKYGLPQFMDVRAVYVNNELVSQAGTDPTTINTGDWDQLDALGKSLVHSSGGALDRWGFDHKTQADHLWLWAMTNGGTMMSDDGQDTSFADGKVVEALTWGKQVYDDQGGMQAYEAFASTWQGDEQFARGQVALTVYENWMMGIIARVNPKMDFSVQPVRMRGGDDWVSFTGGNAWVIPNGAGDADAAWEFIRFMAKPETWMTGAQAVKQTQVDNGASYIPTLSGNQVVDQQFIDQLYEPIGTAYDATVQMWPQLLAKSKPLPLSKSLVGAQIKDALKNDAVLPALRGEKSPEDALKAADDAADEAKDEV